MFTYASAIEALNGLQSNAQYLRNRKLDQAVLTPKEKFDSTIGETLKYLKRVGISPENLSSLPAIHVTGTKGKGSTCAIAESVLRKHGLRTGFFSSPHLVEVRERIRIDGVPIGREMFSRYFWEVYNQLQEQKDDPLDMPAYFRFLTVLATRIFLAEDIHVCIYEVGIGGEYDCTNAVLRSANHVACITPIAKDHTALLGNTLGEIAWHKGGIMKEGGVTLTAPQVTEVREVLERRSTEKGCTLKYYGSKSRTFEDQSAIINLNLGLGIEVADIWVNHYYNKHSNKKIILRRLLIEDAISNCFWPGRYQILQRRNITYYLDGAHTTESMNICAKWYKDKTKLSKNKKVLLYNSTGDRNSQDFFRYLVGIQFDMVLFVPNISKNETSGESEQILKCNKLKETWQDVISTSNDCSLNNGFSPLNGNVAEKDVNNHSVSSAHNQEQIVTVLPNILSALQLLDGEHIKYDLLVTGSLHLVGCLLSLIDPDLHGDVEGVDLAQNENVKEFKQ